MKQIIRGIFLILLILLAGCSKRIEEVKPPVVPAPATNPAPVTPENVTIPSNQGQKKLTVNLYFPDQQSMYLVKVPKEITVVDGAVVKAIIAELQKGDSGYGKVIPAEAKLLNASVKDGIVNLDFSQQFRDKHWGGSSGEAFTIYAIVNSLTELPNIRGVQFYLEGQIQAEMMGHFDWSKPFTRNESLIRK